MLYFLDAMSPLAAASPKSSILSKKRKFITEIILCLMI